MAGKIPTLAWSPVELDALPPVYAGMILREHDKAVESHYAKIEWDRVQKEKKESQCHK